MTGSTSPFSSSKAFGRRRSRWSRLLSPAAVVTATAVILAGPSAAPLQHSPSLSAVDSTADYDLDAAAQVRDAQCEMTTMQRKGGQALKSTARTALNGSDANLLAAADTEYFKTPQPPLAVAFDADKAYADAKMDELYNRHTEWEKSLNVIPPVGYSTVGFQWVEEKDNPFTNLGLSGWISDQYWQSEDDLFTIDQTPLASQDSVNAVNAIAATRYTNASRDYDDLSALQDMTSGHPMYADDARIFLQNGGFPTTAPDPGTMEFRLDVEALKARFASCTTENPPDPHGVLTAELVSASTEWAAEVNGQKAQRDTILGAEAAAAADLQVATQALGESLGQSVIASRLADWQAYWLKQTPASAGLDYPSAAVFTKVASDIVKAQAMALGRLFVASRAAQDAKVQADKATTAEQAAYAIADAAGQPRGRGLLYGQQAAQVTKASAAAALAVAKATETASNATRASAADSKTLMALAQTQAHASQAEFRRAAAQEAADQAKAAADGAAVQATKAAENATKAKTAQAKAETAEATAKAAAADAAKQRATAEAERDKAKTQKDIAATERAKAATAEQTAQTQRTAAATALSAAQTAGATAASKKDQAVQAEHTATTARNNALSAERNRDALSARAAALEAKAAADEGTDAAAASQDAATQARSAADDATTAAANSRSAANDATAAAAAADEAATKAEAAAARSKAASDAAQADVAVTTAAVQTAHAAAADAIAFSEAAGQNARTAKALADTANAKAAEAQADAVTAQVEAAAASASAVQTAGFAYATAQAALAARDSAAQVAQPANDAIELGSPYAETDASAGLAVLTGQAAKTVAEQQAALSQAKSNQAAKASVEAAALAAAASADAKAAATAAADAAASAARATVSANKAQASAAEAATAAKAAVTAETQTVAYNNQAISDAAAAATASTTASGYATDARNSADAAEQDAASARGAATAAETDAASARGIADQAEIDAAVAETAAANAQQAAQDAQDAATRTENQLAQDTLATGGSTGVAGMFTEQKITPIGDPVPMNDCVLGLGNSGCDVKFMVTFNLALDFYFCDSDTVGSDVTLTTCPSEAVTYLGSDTSVKSMYITKHYSNWDIVKGVDEAILKGVWDSLTGDFEDCANGSVTGCLLSAAWFAPPQKLLAAVDLLRAFDASLRTGIGIDDAFNALRALDLDAAVVAQLEQKALFSEEVLVACATNSFPADTQVLMADGSHRAISSVMVGDLLVATDPVTGERHTEPVTATFQHDTQRLVDIAFADGGSLTSTAGHRVYVSGFGWQYVADLQAGDRLRGPDGSPRIVSAVRDRSDLAPSRVYDLTVDNLHTFYVRTQGAQPQDVLVHNCLNLNDELLFPASQAHTLSKHVNLLPQEAFAEAVRTGTNVTIWTNADVAQQAVDRALSDYFFKNPKNWTSFDKWRAKARTGDQYTITGQWDAYPSLGKIYSSDGRTVTDAANKIQVVLMKWPHKGSGGFIVYTSYPV